MDHERVKLREIVRANLLETPTELRATYKGHDFKAELKRDGTIHFLGSIFTAPSMALGAARNIVEGRAVGDHPKPTGGWPYWHYFDKQAQQWLPLETLRKRYLQGPGRAQSAGAT